MYAQQYIFYLMATKTAYPTVEEQVSFMKEAWKWAAMKMKEHNGRILAYLALCALNSMFLEDCWIGTVLSQDQQRNVWTHLYTFLLLIHFLAQTFISPSSNKGKDCSYRCYCQKCLLSA